MHTIPLNSPFISVVLLFTFLAGCAQLTTQDEPPVVNDQTQVPVNAMGTDAEALLEFSLNTSKLAAPARAELCRSLLKRQKETPGLDIQVQILVGRLFSDACGDIPKILDGVAANPNANQLSEPSQKLISIYAEILKRIHSFSKKLAVLERKQKTLQTTVDSKAPKNPKSTQEESQLLRDKLEAIRSMEKQLDEAEPN